MPQMFALLYCTVLELSQCNSYTFIQLLGRAGLSIFSYVLPAQGMCAVNSSVDLEILKVELHLSICCKNLLEK